MPARESAYKRKSKNFLAAAEATHDPNVKSTMLLVAAGYEAMASHVETAAPRESTHATDDAA
jgi:hypothetical protein